MTTDPSWLYSTIAQSSAAIVAIVGGFITASVLMLRAEKRSLAHQQADKKTRLEALKNEREKLLDSHETMRVEIFLKRILDDMREQDELPPLEELIQRYPGWNLDHEILQREYSKLSKRRLEAMQFIYSYSDKINIVEPLTFDEWVTRNKLNISAYDYDMLKDEYDRLQKRQRKVLSQERRSAKGVLGILEQPLPMDLIPHVTPGVTLWDQRELGSIEDRLNNVKYEISLLEREVSNLDGRLTSFRDPQDLRWGLCVLAYFAGVGILFPVLVIAKELYFTIMKQFAIGLFFSGLIAIFGYIVFQINRLRR